MFEILAIVLGAMAHRKTGRRAYLYAGIATLTISAVLVIFGLVITMSGGAAVEAGQDDSALLVGFTIIVALGIANAAFAIGVAAVSGVALMKSPPHSPPVYAAPSGYAPVPPPAPTAPQPIPEAQGSRSWTQPPQPGSWSAQPPAPQAHPQQHGQFGFVPTPPAPPAPSDDQTA